MTCRTCKSPDTELKKGENRLFFVTCNSCGSRRSVAYVIVNYPCLFILLTAFQCDQDWFPGHRWQKASSKGLSTKTPIMVMSRRRQRHHHLKGVFVFFAILLGFKATTMMDMRDGKAGLRFSWGTPGGGCWNFVDRWLPWSFVASIMGKLFIIRVLEYFKSRELRFNLSYKVHELMSLY